MVEPHGGLQDGSSSYYLMKSLPSFMEGRDWTSDSFACSSASHCDRVDRQSSFDWAIFMEEWTEGEGIPFFIFEFSLSLSLSLLPSLSLRYTIDEDGKENSHERKTGVFFLHVYIFFLILFFLCDRCERKTSVDRWRTKYGPASDENQRMPDSGFPINMFTNVKMCVESRSCIEYPV